MIVLYLAMNGKSRDLRNIVLQPVPYIYQR